MNNLTVMIVDDETIVIEDLRTLIDWRKNGYTIVAWANDGHSALESFRVHLPDICLIDIRLPRIDGLELSRRILAIKGNTKILILSAYRDFDYARQALEVGALSYLLKHTLNEQSLLAVLRKTRESIMKDELQGRIMRRELIQEILGAPDRPLNVPLKKLRKHGIEQDTPLALLYMEEDRPFPMLTMDEDPPAAQRGDLPVDERLIPRGMKLFDVIHLGGEAFLVILASGQPMAKAELAPGMKRLACAVQRKIRSSWKATYSAAYLDFSVSVSELRKGYAILKESLAGRIFDGKDAVIAVDALTPALPGPAVNVNHLNGITMAAFTSGFQDLASMAAGVLDETVSSRNVHELRAVCTRMVAFLISLYREKLHYSDEMFLDRWKAQFETFFSAQAVRDWLVAELATVRSIYDGLAGCSALVRQTVEYLHDNYHRPAACLNEIAGTLGMNGTYLGQKFKKETGKTFLHYLTHYRIEKAKAMLHTGKYKVYEIAEKVGYANSQYFSRIFKEATTMTPHAYMEREGSSVES